MPFYRYFQQNEKERWVLIEDTEKTIDAKLKSGAKRVTVLALNTAENEFDQAKVSYRGPFYVDIDNKDSLPDAIASAKELVQRLLSMGLSSSHFEVYASGGKGFHIFVHEKALYHGRAKRYLPLIYKYLAIDLFVPGMDYQVYCLGKGNVFRVPNVQRDDGAYKVRILPEELDTMDEARYRQLCSRPRTNLTIMPMQPPAELNPQLAQMFASAEARWKAADKERIILPVADSKLQQFVNDPPQCVRDLSEGKVRTSVNFNLAAYQMSIYLARSSTPLALADSLMGNMAAHCSSSTYGTERQRRRHLQGLRQYLVSSPKKQFSCPAIKGVLSTRPCDGCALQNKAQEELEDYEIEERVDGYYIVNSQQVARRLTSFVLVPNRMIYEVNSQDGKKRTLIIAEVRHMGEPKGTVRIHEGSWESRSSFVSEFRGLSNLMVKAGDNDIQALKHYVLRNIEDIEDQSSVAAVGIHRERYGRNIRYTYVEDGLSINKFGVINTHVLDAPLAEDQSLLPDFKNHPAAGIGDPDLEKLLRSLFAVNLEEVMGAMLGWFSACHLKAHFMGLYSQFPLMNVWGGVGSGKNQTTTVLGFLAGCDYQTKAPPSMAIATLYPVYASVTSSTTVPRILDEFNTSSGNAKQYDRLTEAFKAAYNANSVSRGTLGGKRGAGGWSARAQNFPMRGPICLLGEQPADRFALNERSLSVELNHKTISHRIRHMEEVVKPNARMLMGVGKRMMIRAINTDDHWVEKQMAGWKGVFPSSLKQRMQYNLQVVGVGLDFLRRVVLEDLQLGLAAEIDGLRAAFISHYQDVRKTQGSHTQSAADRIVDMWADMIMLANANPAAPAGIPSSAYRIEGDRLLIDLQLAYTAARLYSVSRNLKFEAASAKQLLTLLKGEPYYEDYAVHSQVMTARPVLVLKLSQMDSKGLEFSKFLA